MYVLKYQMSVLFDVQFGRRIDAFGLIRMRLTQCLDVFPLVDDAAQQDTVRLHLTISLLSWNPTHVKYRMSCNVPATLAIAITLFMMSLSNCRPDESTESRRSTIMQRETMQQIELKMY